MAKDYFDKVWRPVPDPANPSYRDHWGANLNGTVPLPSSDGTKNEMNFRNSDFYIQDGSYLRLKNIQLGYTLPQKWLQTLSLNRVRLFCSLENFFTFTDYAGMDPETNKLTYPTMRQASFGLNVSF